MPGRPAVVEISVSLKTRQTPRFQAFSGLLLSPNYHPIAPHMGHRLHDAWPWGPRGRAVPGHPGQQFKHGVQHVAVALFQFEQPEQRKKARLLSVRDGAPRLPKPLPALGAASPALGWGDSHKVAMTSGRERPLPEGMPSHAKLLSLTRARQQQVVTTVYKWSRRLRRRCKALLGTVWQNPERREWRPPPAEELRGWGLVGEERAAVRGEEVAVCLVPATTSARHHSLLERHHPDRHGTPPPLLPGRTGWDDGHPRDLSCLSGGKPGFCRQRAADP